MHEENLSYKTSLNGKIVTAYELPSVTKLGLTNFHCWSIPISNNKWSDL